jgi:hypothetical protein
MAATLSLGEMMTSFCSTGLGHFLEFKVSGSSQVARYTRHVRSFHRRTRLQTPFVPQDPARSALSYLSVTSCPMRVGWSISRDRELDLFASSVLGVFPWSFLRGGSPRVDLLVTRVALLFLHVGCSRMERSIDSDSWKPSFSQAGSDGRCWVRYREHTFGLSAIYLALSSVM